MYTTWFAKDMKTQELTNKTNQRNREGAIILIRTSFWGHTHFSLFQDISRSYLVIARTHPVIFLH